MLRSHLFTPLLSALCVSALLLSGYGCTQSEPTATVIVEEPIAATPEPTERPVEAVANEQKVAPPEASEPTSSEPTSSELTTVQPAAASSDPSDYREPPASELSTAEQKLAERLQMANIDEPQAAKDFLEEMRKGAIAQDKDAIANLIHYPFTTYDSGNPIKTYDTPNELLLDFDQVVTPTVLEVMTEAQYKDLFVNQQGAMIGDGEVWFLDYGEGIEIKAINSY